MHARRARSSPVGEQKRINGKKRRRVKKCEHNTGDKLSNRMD